METDGEPMNGYQTGPADAPEWGQEYYYNHYSATAWGASEQV